MDWLDFFKNLPLIVGLTFLLRYGFYLLRCKYYEKNPNEEKGDSHKIDEQVFGRRDNRLLHTIGGIVLVIAGIIISSLR